WMVAKLNLPQPSREVIEFVGRVIREKNARVTISSLEVSLDWCTDTFEDAASLAGLVVPLLRKHGRGQSASVERFPRKGITTGVTIGAGGRGQQLKVYWDRASKVTGFPCLHMEWKLVSRRSVAAIGATEIDDLSSLWHGSFWKNRSPLYTLDYEALGKRLTHRHLSSRADLWGKGRVRLNRDSFLGNSFIKQEAQRLRIPVEMLTMTECCH